MELSEAMKHFPKNPSQALLNFIDDVALSYSRYLFTEKVVGSTYKGYCTYCKKESYLESNEPLKHLSRNDCPNCGASCNVFQRGRGRGQLVDDVYIEFFEKSVIDPNTITASGYYVIRDYRESYTEPRLIVSRSAMYVYTLNESAMFSKSYYEHTYQKRKSVFSLNTVSFGRKLSFMNSAELNEVLEGTPFQYALPKQKHIKNEYMLGYLDLYTKYPFIEVLVKHNCASIVLDRLLGRSTKGAINWRGKTLDKIYGLPKRDWKHFSKVKQPIGTADLINYKALRVLDIHQKITPLELMEFCMSYNATGTLLWILKKTSLSLQAAFKYIRKQKEYFDTEAAVVRTWSDYLAECEGMHLDITGSYAMPRDLYTVHQRQIERKKAVADAKLNVKISRRAHELSSCIFEFGDYIIRPFHSAQELTREGHLLKHCIAGYAKRYAEGETDLFSVRLKNAPYKPLYSAEVSVKDKAIKQVHGLSNKAAPVAARAALELMLDNINSKKTKKSKQKVREKA